MFELQNLFQQLFANGRLPPGAQPVPGPGMQQPQPVMPAAPPPPTMGGGPAAGLQGLFQSLLGSGIGGGMGGFGGGFAGHGGGGLGRGGRWGGMAEGPRNGPLSSGSGGFMGRIQTPFGL